LPEEMKESKLFVFWGFNAAVSSPHFWALTLGAKRNGAMIVAVDPRKSETVLKSDFYLNPRPGTDVALAYGVMHVLMASELYDRGFVEKYTVGFKPLREKALKWTPSHVAEVTGIEETLVKRLTELYVEKRPA